MSIYLKHDKIKGSVTNPEFKGALELTSVEWGVGRYIGQKVGNSANREAGEATISEVHIRRKVDGSSPTLFEHASKIKDAFKVELIFISSGNSTYLRIELENAMLSSYSFTGRGDSEDEENFSISFTKMEYKYITRGADNKPGTNIVGSFDVAAAA
ncbi:MULTISPECIES: type VI secretion system tube protein Hcp [unclassified Chelatococcus]|uniref:Hcp family type VI secretion system effector n=1 Tax=unclassified Chelatococcus TaxID=2638111 RepID=UPI001BCD80E2|nr:MULTISPECIES: type VI secretion system tube protein Hcp [unclassified Chelatococcus]MBS7697294.1 type VI secretion system tube protein Hcp [Chelatococcus sp. YT9]MBX3556409.1 type VI secretion system tube protein Hcp [Chelatococcus sp.]